MGYFKRYPGQVFIRYTALRSFLKASTSLQFRSRKWIVNEGIAPESVLQQASLPIEKFKDPLIVFKNAPSY